MTVQQARELVLNRKPVYGDRELTEASKVLFDYIELKEALEQSNFNMILTALEELDLMEIWTANDKPRRCKCELDIIVKKLDEDCPVHTLLKLSPPSELKQSEKQQLTSASTEESSTGTQQD